MKKIFGFMFVAASLLLSSGAQAQEHRVRATVPFDFAIGNTTYAAGTYDISSALSNDKVALVTGEDMPGRMLIVQACSSPKPAEKTVLVFHRTGGEYFLYQIWIAGNSTGRELPRSKAEMRLAHNDQSQDVIVAANLVQ
jgi:hypothetical protein